MKLGRGRSDSDGSPAFEAECCERLGGKDDFSVWMVAKMPSFFSLKVRPFAPSAAFIIKAKAYRLRLVVTAFGCGYDPGLEVATVRSIKVHRDWAHDVLADREPKKSPCTAKIHTVSDRVTGPFFSRARP